MTERRPAHEPVPDFVERQILEAQERGDFDGLAGAGRPLPGLDQPRDELWWVKRKLRDEHITELPPALRARRDRDRALTEALDAATERDVRRIVAEVNQRIRTINRTTWHGPPTATGPLDVEVVVARWRNAHPERPDAPEVEAPSEATRGGDATAASAADRPRPAWLSRVARRVARRARRR